MPRQIAAVMDKMLMRSRSKIEIMTNREIAVYFKDTVTMLPTPVTPSAAIGRKDPLFEFSNDELLAARLLQKHFRNFQTRKKLAQNMISIKNASESALEQSCEEHIDAIWDDLKKISAAQDKELMTHTMNLGMGSGTDSADSSPPRAKTEDDDENAMYALSPDEEFEGFL